MSKRIYTLMIDVEGPKRVALEHNRRLNILERFIPSNIMRRVESTNDGQNQIQSFAC